MSDIKSMNFIFHISKYLKCNENFNKLSQNLVILYDLKADKRFYQSRKLHYSLTSETHDKIQVDWPKIDSVQDFLKITFDIMT